MSDTFTCCRCGQSKPVQTNGGTGYASTPDGKMCYVCCGEADAEYMREHGKITLYLTCEPASRMTDNGKPYTPATIGNGRGRNCEGTVTNWPGTLKFRCHTRVGRHNIARYRYDVWFTGPDGEPWHGVTYGDNTQICHCRRIKG